MTRGMMLPWGQESDTASSGVLPRYLSDKSELWGAWQEDPHSSP